MPIETLNQQQPPVGPVDHPHPAADDANPTAAKKARKEEGEVKNKAAAKEEEEDKEPIWKQTVWKNKQDNGDDEPIVELEQEPRHHVSFVNDYTKIITIRMDPNDTTLAHRHQADTIIVICMKDGVDFINDVMGCCGGPAKGRMEFGQVGFAPYTSKPCVHKITNLSPHPFFVVNVEVRAKPPLSSQKSPMVLGECHTLVKEQPNCRIYKLSLEPGQRAKLNYAFFHVRIVLRGTKIKITLLRNNDESVLSWTENLQMGDTEWKEPCVNMAIENVGTTKYEAYICELV